MLSFIGDYSCKADSKSRIVVPVSFRKAMLAAQQTVFVLRKNIYESCLDMYPYSEWEMLAEGLRIRLNRFNRTEAAFLREWYRGTQEVEMDGNGRILLPKRLLEEIGVEKDIVLAGQDGKIEVWSEDAYRRSGIGAENFAALTQQVFGK